MDVYLEVGTKRVFAGALQWPGWCRSARDEGEALSTFFGYAGRYAQVVEGTDLRPALVVPKRAADLRIVERLTGDATTDFGAPSGAPAVDLMSVKPSDLRDLLAILQACWGALDRAAASAVGVELTKGPRGGGRDLAAILEHVRSAEASYARRIAIRPAPDLSPDASSRRAALRASLLDGLTRAVTEGIPPVGPRGGVMWTPRYLVRRAAWHVLDHAWEIEDRSS